MLSQTLVLRCEGSDFKLRTWLVSEELTWIVRRTGAQRDGDAVHIGTDLHELRAVHRKTQISIGNSVLRPTRIFLWGVRFFWGFGGFWGFWGYGALGDQGPMGA